MSGRFSRRDKTQGKYLQLIIKKPTHPQSHKVDSTHAFLLCETLKVTADIETSFIVL